MHVDAHVGNRLRAVDQHARAVTMRGLHHLLHRYDGTQGIGDVGDGDRRVFGPSNFSYSSEQHLPESSTGGNAKPGAFSAHSNCHGTMLA